MQTKILSDIHTLFAVQAARNPNATALLFGEERWSYQRLNERSNQIARQLQNQGVRRESIVALLMDRSCDMIAMLLGVLKAGGAYAPLDPSDPPARIRELIASLQPKVIGCDAKYSEIAGGYPIVNVESIPVDAPAASLDVDCLPDSLAYVMFTSGSTGTPKGVLVEHRSIVRLFRGSALVPANSSQVFLQLAPLAFDASTFEIWGALLNGSALAIMPAGLPSLAEIAGAIRRYEVTTLWLTSGLFNAMVEQQLDTLASVKQVYSGGDVLSPVHVRKFLDACGADNTLTNGYGPTENTVFTCAYVIPKDHPADMPVPIGKPVAHTTIYLLDGEQKPVNAGEVGELYTGGAGLARGYLNNPELTAEKFLEAPVEQQPGARMYRTGDLARLRPDGVVEFMGRADQQIKLCGFRIEPGEIETLLLQHAAVRQAAVVVRQSKSGEKRLVAYLVSAYSLSDTELDIAALRAFVGAKLPPYMVPAQFVSLHSLPLNVNGKVDRRALPDVQIESKAELPKSELEKIISEAWSAALGISSPEPDQAFFEIGGSSLQLMRVQADLERKLGRPIATADLFRCPTIRGLAEFLSGGVASTAEGRRQAPVRAASRSIAIVGMAGRFPGAKNIAEFWENLKSGVESISHFSDDELEVSAGPNAVKARSILEDVEMFDAAYFGITPKEAERIDPQHRVFLECSQEALDDAGYDPSRYPGAIGVFAGCSPNSYFLRHLCTDRKFIDDYTAGYQVANYPTMLGSSPDYLSSRVSYKLNLTGPSITMGTACSTSLVAATQACESLLSGQCDMALAGGVSITLPQKRSYEYTEGGLASADGHCRPFDANAQGTVFGSGCAVVLLKRLEDAIADGDSVYAVIKGYGINNDGAGKAGFTAPSVEGQARAIRKAHQVAGVDPSTITYIEAHGTATPLGDPIEIAALTDAFREHTSANQFCAIGTAKGNVGHLDAASGVTGLIKTALSLKYGTLPPLPNFQAPNPRIDFSNSPFYVNRELTEWKAGATPLRAGVSAFGIGGTNAHMVLEQAPATPKSDSRFGHHVLLLSAKTPEALQRAGVQLAAHLGDANLADAAYTLQTGRRSFDHRRIVVCSDAREGAAKLSQPFNTTAVKNRLPIVFAFPGQGTQYTGMGQQLYRALPQFREAFDECSSALGVDLNWVINSAPLDKTNFAQPAIFATEYALAKQWMAWGIQPEAMIGHSVGEFVAACLAGVFSLEDGLKLVAERGRMMQELAGGVMLSVRASEEQLRARLVPDVAIAAVNSPALCVAAGPEAAIASLESALSTDGIVHKRLRTSHAFHSQMVDPILGALATRVQGMSLNSPKLRYVSTLTGEWITTAETTNPDYFVRHCRETVQFSAAVRCLQGEGAWCVLEVGPGQSLTTLARQHGMNAVSSLSTPDQPELAGMMNALGGLWLAGNAADWSKVYKGQQRRRVSLPTYPFDRKRFWIEAPQQHSSSQERKPLMTVVSTVVSPSVSTPSRQNRLRQELIALLEDLSGLDLASTAGATFLEMGFDSLFLTQVSQAVENKYRLKVRFARLLDDLSTVEQLTAFLDGNLPADTPAPVAVSTAPVVAPPVLARAPTASTGIEQLIKDQLAAFAELTAKQFAMMQSAGPASAVPVVALVREEPKPEPAETPKFESFGPFKPIQKTAEEFTPQQREYIQAFIERYNRRTQESKRLTQKHRVHLADPRVAAGFRTHWKEIVYPLSIERSAGSKLWDVDGNEYVDLLNGFGVTMFGHRPQFVQDAVARQLFEGFEIGPQTPYAGKVADLLCEMTGMERAAFTNTGSEAVMAALRVARTVTNRKKIVYFAGDYHGMFDEVLVKGANKAGILRSRPIAPGIPEEMAANAIVLEYGAPESLEIIRAHAGELAAVLVEPVQSRHPHLVPIEFLRQLRQITQDNEIALIFDEVVTGFRTHPGGAQALFNIRADMATYGKVIGGGLPVGVLAGSAKYMDALDGGMWQYGDASFPEAGVTFFAGTFVRHPLAMAATWAVLNHLKQRGPRLQEELSEKTGRLVRSLNDLFEANSVPTHIENFRSIFYFSFPSDQRLASLLYYHVREKGVHIQEGFPCFLTTAHTEEDLELVVNAFRDSIAEMRQGGLLTAAQAIEKLAAPVSLPVPAVASAVALTPAPIAAVPVSFVEAEVPLTEAQLEIRLSAQLGDEESCSFNEGFGIHLQGVLNQPALNQSLQLVVNRHEALRATLGESGESIRILNHVDVPFRVIDISALGEDERGHRIAQLKEEDAKTAFDLVHGPLVRAQLVRLAAEEHLLLITAHHLVCDGWSINIVLDELAKLYSANCQPMKAELAKPLPQPMSFAAYARSQATQSVDLEVEDYWSSEFATPVAPLELPVDRPRPALKSYHGATAVAKVAEAHYRTIKRASAQSNATLLGALLTGFQALLARLTGQSDIVVGIPAAAQAALAGQTLVGHCVNLLPIRVKATGEMKFSELLAVTRRKLIDAYEHQSYTYGTLVRKLAIPRNPSRLPLIEVQFNLERVGEKLDLAGIDCTVEQSAKRFVNFDLFLNVVESSQGLTLYCDYNTDLFDESTIQRWLLTYQNLLLAFAADSSQLLSDLSLLGDADRHKMLFDWNTTSASYPKNKSFDQIFSEQASITPEATAVRCGADALTYAELDKRSNQLAHYLTRSGVTSGTQAGILLDPSINMPVAVLAVLKTGAAYVPLDPSYPQDRLDFIRQDAGLQLTLSAENWPSFESESDVALPGLDPDRLAYVIYTSGSTGVPKGVEISHRALVNFLWSMQRQPGLSPQDKLLAVTTLSFDIAGLELLLPLTVGAEVVIASREARRDGRALLQLIETAGITVMQATPTTWKLMLNAGWARSPNLKVLCGGEELTRDLANELVPRTASVWNMYGPTETTIWSTCERVLAGEGPVSIGKPIANTLLYVLDTQGRPAPLGVPGELYIGGDGLARGYHNRPELTAERFFLNPFLRHTGARLYRTGDLVRFLPDGRLIYMGRLDNQVKIRGHRIELGEIEAALLEQPAVQDAAVIVREDEPGEKRLVAYIVAAGNDGLVSGDLRSLLALRLPEYMIPSLFAVLESLPLTPNGKIDRKALSALPSPQAIVEDRYVCPRTDLERTLASIWEEVLRVARVGIDDDLFELGADSIHLFLISSRAAQRGVQLTPKQLLQHRNIHSICAVIEEQNVANRQAPPSTIARASREKYRIERPA